MKADLYVAPDGNDIWSGKLPSPNDAGTDGPFATIARARDAVRAARRVEKEKRPSTVLIRGGTYYLSEPVVFSPADSGTKACPVLYAAYPGEKPIISGGRVVTGWKRQGDVWTVHIPEVEEGKWYFHQLFVNGERRTRARTPNEGYLRTAGPIETLGNRDKARRDRSKKMGFRYEPSDLRKWHDLDDVNIFVYHAWTASMHWIASLDEEDRIVRFTAPSNWPIGWWENNQRYYVENYREALDSPGEWYLDRKTGVLSYWPLQGEDMRKAEVIAPRLRQLVLFNGDPANGNFVDHVTIRGLSFAQADWQVANKGFADGQAGVMFLKGAIHAVGARHCVIENCEIAHVGEYAVWLALGCRDNLVRRCHIHDMGGGGVCLGETKGPSNKPESDPNAAERNTVDNCFIHDGGHVWREGVGIWIGRSSYNRVSHNEICDFNYSGMSIGWNWGFAPSSANHNIAECNYIHHIGRGVLSDMGGIYTLGVSPGTVLRNNLIHDVYSYSYGGWGLYTDEGSSDILLEHNVVYDTKTGGFHQHYGRENIVRNNIFACSREAQIIRSREEDHISFTFERNIVYCDNGYFLGKRWENGNYRIDYNLYWDTSGAGYDFAGRDWEEWQAKGHDTHSIIADPRFVGPARRDFRLKQNCPASKIGFRPIDMSTVGLYGDPEWTGLPKRVKREAVPLPPLSLEEAIEDDFEATAVGAPAALAMTRGEEHGASIRVSDETAAAGRHSLKFTDVPGLKHAWQPHIYYQPHYHRGIVRLSFDLRLEDGAVFYHEWRDASRPYRIGPSIRIGRDGELMANGRPLVLLPRGKWVHFEIVCKIGMKSDGTYDLVIGVPGERAKEFHGLPVGSPKWKRLRWLGFNNCSDGKTVFYLDNIALCCQRENQ